MLCYIPGYSIAYACAVGHPQTPNTNPAKESKGCFMMKNKLYNYMTIRVQYELEKTQNIHATKYRSSQRDLCTH